MLDRLSFRVGMIVFLLLSGFSTYNIVETHRERLASLTSTAEEQASAIVRLIAGQIVDDVKQQRFFAAWDELSRSMNAPESTGSLRLLGFSLTDDRDRVIAHSDPQAHPVQSILGPDSRIRHWHGNRLHVSAPVGNRHDQPVGTLQLMFEERLLSDRQALLQHDLLLSVVWAVILSGGFAWGIGLLIASPINRLRRDVGQIGKGAMGKNHLSAWYPREIRELEYAFAEADRTICDAHAEVVHGAQMLHDVMEESSAAIAIRDMNGCYIEANRMFEQTFMPGNGLPESRQQNNVDGSGDCNSGDSLEACFEQVRKTGRKMVRQMSVVQADAGHRLWRMMLFPLGKADDHIYGICAFAVDITDEQLADERIRTLAAVVKQTTEIVVVTDPGGVITYVNPAFERISGYTAAEAIGNTPKLVNSGEHKGSYYASMWHVLLGGRPWHGDFINRNRHGELYYVSQAITPILNEHGGLLGFASVQRDVTEERKLQAKIQHGERVQSLGVLAGGIAHDFNNLLTAILGNCTLAIKKIDTVSAAYRHLQAIEQASHSAADLCRQMLAYSGKGMFVVKPVNLSVLVYEMGKLLQVSIEKSVTVRYDLCDTLPLIDADIAQMQQMLLNLITNASEAIGQKHGVVTIATGVISADEDYLNGCISDGAVDPGEYVFIEVSDTGCGMDADTQKRIFDPFFTTKFSGRGLGMSAMLGIVRGHKGALRIYSEAGKGTSIKIVFPFSHEQDVPPSELDDTASDIIFSGRALLVDDEEYIRQVASSMLEEMGFTVDPAFDGLHALEFFRRDVSYDIVLLDMTMPRMGGEQCFRELRRINPNVRVILSSGYNEQLTTNRFAGKGLAGFIQKPYSFEQLKNTLTEIMQDDA